MAPRTHSEDYYKLLEVAKEASVDEIKKAYRKKAIQYHPDKNPGNKEAEEMFKKVSEAYEVLQDPQKRASYDRLGHAAFQSGGGSQAGGGGGFHDPYDIFREVFTGAGGGSGIFESFFGGNFARPDPAAPETGADLRYDLEITLEDAAKGLEKEIQYHRAVTCNSCNGIGAQPGSKRITCSPCKGRGYVIASSGFINIRQACPNCSGKGTYAEKPCQACGSEGRTVEASKITVKVPAGVGNGSKLRSSGQGEAGLRGGPAGDLYVVIHVKEHPIFERHSHDLHCILPIKFTLAALGGMVEVPTLEGKSALLKIPSGTQSGTIFKLKGYGMPRLRTTVKGDLFVRVEIEVPTHLTSDQREKLEAFAIACGDAPKTTDDPSFFEKLKRKFD